jgi:hypothetical protein
MKSVGSKFTLALISVLGFTVAAHGQGMASSATPTASVKDEQVRAIVTAISGIGTAGFNSSAVDVKQQGVELVALGKADRFTLSKDGKVQISEKIVQFNFVLPQKSAEHTTLQDLCLGRLQALQQMGAGKQSLELTFNGRRYGAGNYIVSKILGCADVPKVAIKSPKPTSTPKPGMTPAPKK